MARFLAALLSILACACAFAADKGAEAPIEPASTAVVIGFLVLFFGSIVAYGVYLWWTARGKPSNEE